MSGEETDLIHIDSETEQQVRGDVDEGLQSLLLAILVKVKKINGTSLPICLLTKDIVREVFKENMGTEYQLSTIDILNDREFIFEMDPPCTYSSAVIKLQKLMTGYRGTGELYYGRFWPFTRQMDKRRKATTSMGAHSNNLLDQMVDRMMGHMNQTVRRLESLIQQRPNVPSIPSICNQSSAMERMIGPERMGLMNRHPRLVTYSGSENPQKGKHTFTQWLPHYEVSEPSYPEDLMRETIVGSLHGNAYESIRGLGPRVPVFKIVETLKNKYQSRTNPDLMIQEIYKINQGPKEPKADWTLGPDCIQFSQRLGLIILI